MERRVKEESKRKIKGRNIRENIEMKETEWKEETKK
jgi:hypothetical protein